MVVYNQSNDMVLLTYLPPGSKDTPAVDVINVGVSDGFNGADDDDLTLRIEVSVTEIDKPITSNFVTFHVNGEHAGLLGER